MGHEVASNRATGRKEHYLLKMMNFPKDKKKDDLGIKIVSKDVALWSKVVDGRKAAITQYEEAIKVEKVFLAAAEAELKRSK